MTPLKLLKLVHERLEKYRESFAVAGGLAASFYRVQPRLTNDVDLAFSFQSEAKSRQAATKIIKSLGFNSALGWIDDPTGKLKKRLPLLIGRPDKNELESTIDFLLPAFPWVKGAIARAQHNCIDYGFDKIPTLTPEDLIIAKAFALGISPNRFQDLDDIQSIFKADNQLDLLYLVQEFERLELSLPRPLLSLAPAALRRACRRG